ncbi:MAG: FAD:protein FMN transferase [Lachnospiraceae bacterium]|nr:FAD:protein FMN transferase [Lachnospiraceae bacterium]
MKHYAYLYIFLLVFLCFPLTGCQSKNAVPYQTTNIAMGTTISMSLYGDGELSSTGDAVLDTLREIENSLISWRVADSEIAQANASAGSVDGFELSDTTAAYLETVLEVAKNSDGALDITLGRLSRLWDIGGSNPQVPEASEILELLADIGYEKVTLSSNTLLLPSNMSLDLGAVGKGIGCDEIYDLLRANSSVNAATVSVGGSIITYGSKPDGSNWNVAITDPRYDNSYLGILSLSGTNYISTSGDYEKYIMEDDMRYHHILDPLTGYPAQNGLISVTIVCDNGLLSDALSTACFVAGYEKSLELLKIYDADAIFVDENYNVYVTDGITDAFTLSNDVYTLQ